ncbi:MAG: alanine--tRNA ligase [Acidobacteriota bacterium]|nr:alanine--tRNA ligase [Acidobacteriota bacterium]
MTGNEIRELFLRYFEQRGHTRVRSSPLLPANDPTLLFTNAGMNQFKDVFLGLEKRDYVRACSSQKCVRAGGKHNDLDEVGKTARHQTFFEMLGNFSFGDYFKRDAIQYAWDFLTGKREEGKLGLDPERLWFTVFGGDDEVGADEEAAALWVEVGARPERILRFGREDNFWQMAETGPCGPNSEINYYLGEHPEDPEFNRADLVNGPGDTTMEIWNLVFMQYNRIEVEPGKYKLEPLPKPSVDTGMGLERTAVILQGKFSNYDTDLIRPIVEFTAKLAGRNYESETQEGFAMRVIADHARATAFLIADGILPGNEGRNYVLRKIMRRAIYQGRHALGFQNSFFHKATNFVVDLMHEPYPELEAQRDFIEKMVKLEEERFGSTLSVGLNKLDELLDEMHPDGGMIPAVKLAQLTVPMYDTYGLPRDLIRVALVERGHDFAQDEDAFNEMFDDALRQLQQARPGSQREGIKRPRPVYQGLVNKGIDSKFTGYEETTTWPVRVKAVIKNEGEPSELREGENGEVVLDQTPFYAEAGGQVGDTGELISEDGLTHAIVNDTFSPLPGLIVHQVTVDRGILRSYPPGQYQAGSLTILEDPYPGHFFTAKVDVEKRDATRRNHTATHLMHAALREVLGTHVKQAGSVVAPNYLRFDFTHYQSLTTHEIEEIERLVNFHILRNEPVETNEMAVEEAMRSGAMALFGEKYGEKVRVLSIKGAEDVFSKELCGGTHVRATGDIGVFKITSDESIASGVRRIRAITGVDAYERFREDELLIDQVASGLRTSRAELPAVVGKLQDELKKARREAEELRMKIASGPITSSSSNGDESREIAGVRVVAREASGLDSAGMRQLSDTLLARIKSGVIVLGRSSDGKVSLIVRTSADLTGKVPAGQVIKELAPIVGGKGGGKADMAEGGGSQPEKLSEALEASYAIVERLLS